MTQQPTPVLMVPVDIAQQLADLRTEIARLHQALATTPPASEWMTIPEAMQRIGCSRATINRRIQSGQLIAKGSGKMRLVKPT